MEWIPVMINDTAETVAVGGYECSMCGYISMWERPYCPHCRRRRGVEDVPDDPEDDGFDM